ncbi:TPA: MerR family transcriptional regulator [Streptococcus suis]
MRVKDVERLTGLSTKAIRLYEEKGLISVERNPVNDYRDYSVENVRQLRLIKLLRYFDFSLSEIEEPFTWSEEGLKSALLRKKQAIIQKQERLTNKIDLLDQVVKDLGKKDGWLEEIQNSITYVESDDFQELKKDIEYALLPSIWMTLLQTFILSGPILWLFTRIEQGRQENLLLLSILSLFASAWITLLWRDYLVTWWKNRDKVFILLIMTFLILLFGKLARLLRLSWKYLLALTVSCILLMALLISTTTAVTNNRIIEINLIVPSKEFVYSDVKSVWTGFGTKLFTLDETKRQGTFSYCIDLDGEEKVFMQPTVNQKLVSDDTYIELEEFDQRLMELGISKESSAEGSQYNDLDPHYVERFLRIIENK